MSTLLSSDEALQKHNLGRGRGGGGMTKGFGGRGRGVYEKWSKSLIVCCVYKEIGENDGDPHYERNYDISTYM